MTVFSCLFFNIGVGMNIKTSLMAAVVLIALVLMSGTAMAATPISSAADLAKIGTDPGFLLSDEYELTQNISISGGSWTSIGNYDNPFTGKFDGKGYVITFTEETTFATNPSSVYPSGDAYGLFANTVGVEFKNVHIIATNNLIAPDSKFGALVGSSKTTEFENCSVKMNDGFSLRVVMGTMVGGLIGVMSDGNISKSFTACDIYSPTGGAGGLVGSAMEGNISESYATGNVTGNVISGGLVGNFLAGRINESYATGIVTGSVSVGGIVGSASNYNIPSHNPQTLITDCFYITNNVVGGNAYGTGITDAELKQYNTFSGSWSIASTPDSTKTWYINDGNAYPIFYWQYVPVKSGGGSGTGSATVVDTTKPVTPSPVEETVKEPSEVPTTVSPEQGSGNDKGYTEDTKTEENPGRDWTLYGIIAVGLIVVIGAVYVVINKNKP